MRLFYLFILVFYFIFTIFQNTLAIPSFARKYQISCQTCHAPFPKLKPYGDEFAGDGFVIKDKETPRAFVETGDQELLLLKELPFAIKLEGYATYNNNNSELFDFTSPYLLKLLSGGEISKNISYYFYFFVSERGEVAGIEDAFVMFNNLLGTDLDFYVGQFQVSDPLFKRELRLTFEDYLIYKIKPGKSKLNLAYDRGIMLTYGLPLQMDLTIEILNGNGINPANEDYNVFDNDKYKNYFVRLSQDIIEEIRIGGFANTAKEKLSSGNVDFINEIKMFGGDFTLKYDKYIELNGQFIYREDSQCDLNLNTRKTKGGFAEIIFTPEGDESKWYLSALYNHIESDLTELNYKAASLHFGYLLKRNIRTIAEIKRNFEEKYNQFSLGIILAY
jgi:hypothetical protein